MIAKIHGMYVLVCDNCGDEYPETYNDFYEAAEAKKKNGWKMLLI